MIRKESQYVICANCKSTLLIEKDVYDIRPPEYYNLTPKEYYLLLAKENSFNPYQFPEGNKNQDSQDQASSLYRQDFPEHVP